MDWILNLLGLGNLVSSISSTVMWIAAAWFIFQFAGPIKTAFAPLLAKIGEYLPSVTDYVAGGAKGLQVLGASSVVVLALVGGGLYYTGKASGCDCKKQVEANMTDLRAKYRFVPK